MIFLLPILLSGCFEIREEVNMKAGGSGEINWVANFSQSKDNLRRYMKMERVEGYKVPKQQDIESFLAQVKSSLAKVEGISHVMVKSDWSSYIFTVSARFSNVQALNKALALMDKQMENPPSGPATENNFAYENGRFRRVFRYAGKPDAFKELSSTQRYMLESARMTSIYRFENDIADFTNKRAQVSPSGKAIMLQVPLADLAKGTATIENIISF